MAYFIKKITFKPTRFKEGKNYNFNEIFIVDNAGDFEQLSFFSEEKARSMLEKEKLYTMLVSFEVYDKCFIRAEPIKKRVELVDDDDHFFSTTIGDVHLGDTYDTNFNIGKVHTKTWGVYKEENGCMKYLDCNFYDKITGSYYVNE